MEIKAQVLIDDTKESVWNVITDIEGSVNTIGGIEKIEILETQPDTLVGLKWRETRTMFGQTATEVMWITDAVENEYYTTRAESHGAIYKTELRVSENEESTQLSMVFTAEYVSWKAKLLALIWWIPLTHSMKKALQKDLGDIKKAVETRN